MEIYSSSWMLCNKFYVDMVPLLWDVDSRRVSMLGPMPLGGPPNITGTTNPDTSEVTKGEQRNAVGQSKNYAFECRWDETGKNKKTELPKFLKGED